MSCFYLSQTKYSDLTLWIPWNRAQIPELLMMMNLQLSSLSHITSFSLTALLSVREIIIVKKKFATCNSFGFTATTLCMSEMCLVWQTSGQKQTCYSHTQHFFAAAAELKWIFDGRSIRKCQLTDTFLHPHLGNNNSYAYIKCQFRKQ